MEDENTTGAGKAWRFLSPILAFIPARLASLAILGNETALRLYLYPFVSALRFFFGYAAVWETGQGWVIEEAKAVIDGSCSGLDYFSLLLPLLIFLSFPEGRRHGFRAWSAFYLNALLVASGTAWTANLLRLLSSQALGPLKLALGLSFYSAHNAEGMLIFLSFFLLGLSLVKRRNNHA